MNESHPTARLASSGVALMSSVGRAKPKGRPLFVPTLTERPVATAPAVPHARRRAPFKSSSSQRPTNAKAPSRGAFAQKPECGEEDLNLHALSSTSTSSLASKKSGDIRSGHLSCVAYRHLTL